MKQLKYIIAAIIMVIAMFPARAWKKSVYLELLGPSTFAGVWLDARLPGASGLGFGLGLAAVPSQTDDIGRWTAGTWSAGLPLAVNYLTGSGNHHFELGAGMHNAIMKTADKNYRWGYYFFMNIGYRFQGESGFVFRTGLSPSWQRRDRHSIIKRRFYPYLAFGWAF